METIFIWEDDARVIRQYQPVEWVDVLSVASSHEKKMRKILAEFKIEENLKFNLSRFRPKSNQSSPPPVLVRFEDDETRERVFFAAKKYRNLTYLKNIFIKDKLESSY